MSKLGGFLKRKDVIFTKQRYLYDSLSFMALGLFASLIIGLIVKTLGEQVALLLGDGAVTGFLTDIGAQAMSLSGAAIGVAVAYGLKAPPLVLFTCVITGALGNSLGGPAGAYCAAVVGAEFGKMVSKETKLDIILTPLTTLVFGSLSAMTLGTAMSYLMKGLGDVIMRATTLQPFLMGIIVSAAVGLVLTAPISSAALCIMMDLSGIAAGAATIGCCCQMIGFAVISFRDNGVGGFFAQGLGTSMLQVPNIVKNWRILLPPTLSSMVLGPLATVVFKMTNQPSGAGMGTSGLVGQIVTFSDMGFSVDVLLKVLLLHFVLPAVVTYIFYFFMRKKGWIKDGDMKLSY